MKKLGILLCVLLMLFSFTACSADSDKNAAQTEKPNQNEAAAQELPFVLNTTEYTLYQNIFFNKQGADYENKQTVKEGVFATLTDAYNNVTRYYVWGYNDQTKCCDWQWEIKPDDTSSLPSNGSKVKVTGTFTKSDDALDGYWITSPEIAVETAYNSGIDADIDMSTMSGTLERVEIQNIMYKKESFEGKTVAVYGRVVNPKAIQHPYYDNTWQMDVTGDVTLPDFGKMVLVRGTVKDGAIAADSAEETQNY